MRLRSKLGLAFFLGSALPLTLALVVTHREARDGARALTVRSAQAIVGTAAERLSGFFAERKAEIAAYAEDPALRSQSPEAFLPFLRARRDDRPAVYEKFMVGLPDGRYFNTEGGNPALGGVQSADNRDPRARPLSIAHRDYWARTIGPEAKPGRNLVVSRPNVSITTGVPQVVVATTVLDLKGKPAASLGGSVRLEAVRTILDQVRGDLLQEFGPRTAACLVSADGSYVSHWDPARNLQDPGGPSAGSLDIYTVRGASRAASILEEQDPFLRRAGRAMVTGRAGFLAHRAPDGEARYLIHAPVPSAGYAMAVDIPSQVIWNQTGRLAFTFGGALAASLALAALGAMVLSRRIAGPVQDLTEAAHRVAEGDFSHPVEVQGPDEVVELAGAFRAMTREVAQREGALEQGRLRLESLVRELTAARDEARAADRVKGRFLNAMSHELRTPLNAILLYAQLLEGDDPPPDELANIQRSARRLLELVEDVLSLADLERGQVVVDEAPFDLAAELERVHGAWFPAARRKGLELDLETGLLPERPLRGDAVRMRRVLGHLLENALKFTSRGRVVLRAEVEAEASAALDGRTWVRFEVEDSGGGLSPEAMAHLFEPFVQEESPSGRKGAGPGLGLALCARLVAGMDGRIGVENEPGQGARFTVRLPFGTG